MYYSAINDAPPDAACNNSWFIHRRTLRGGSQLPFVRELAKVLIKRNTVPRPAHHARYRRFSICEDDIRFDNSLAQRVGVPVP